MMKKILGEDPIATLKSSLLVILGTVILAAGVAIFMIPFDLVAGGVTGIAIVLDLLIASEAVTAELCITVITWLFFILGLIFVGKDFALKTLISTVVYPPAVALFGLLVDPEVLGGYFYLPACGYPEVALVIATLGSGACVGVGVSLAFLANSSTGGVDIIAVMLCKYFPKLKMSKVTFIIDAVIIILGAVAVGNIVVTLLGIISAFVSALLIDVIFLGGRRAYIAQINSDHYDEIRRAIIEEMDRTATIYEVTGGYSGNAQHVVMVSFTTREYSALMKIIKRVDATAFVTVHRAHEINGYGWTFD